MFSVSQQRIVYAVSYKAVNASFLSLWQDLTMLYLFFALWGFVLLVGRRSLQYEGICLLADAKIFVAVVKALLRVHYVVTL